MEKKNMNKIIEKMKQFFSYLKKEKKSYLPEKTIQNQDQKQEFKESLNVKEEQETLRLQRQYEQDGTLEGASTFQMIELIQLYKEQIHRLDIQLAIAKTKMNKI